MFSLRLAAGAVALTTVFSAQSAPEFVNAIVIDANTLDASGGTAVNDGRLGFFSDIYYDPRRDEWWALSDRGPGGGTLTYEVRVHRFKLDVNRRSGEIGNFQVLATRMLRRGGEALQGLAPRLGGPLGMALRPRGRGHPPAHGHLLISDEYGPSLLEFSRSGQSIRRYRNPGQPAAAQRHHRRHQFRQRRRQHGRQAHQPGLRGPGHHARWALRVRHAAKRDAR